MNRMIKLFSAFSHLDEQQQQQRCRHGDRKKAEGRAQSPGALENPIPNALRLDGEELVVGEIAVWNLDKFDLKRLPVSLVC